MTSDAIQTRFAVVERVDRCAGSASDFADCVFGLGLRLGADVDSRVADARGDRRPLRATG